MRQEKKIFISQMKKVRSVGGAGSGSGIKKKKKEF